MKPAGQTPLPMKGGSTTPNKIQFGFGRCQFCGGPNGAKDSRPCARPGCRPYVGPGAVKPIYGMEWKP